MHQHAREWQRPDYFERLVWDFERTVGPQGSWGDWHDAPGLDPPSVGTIERLVACVGSRLAHYGKAPERFGLIHADLRLANLLETPGDTRVIAFDDAGVGWFLYDIASALSFMEDRDDLDLLVDAWVTGYRTKGELSDEDVAEIPTFLMLRRLAILAWIGSHSDTDLARELGVPFTQGTTALAERYLARVESSN